MLGRESAHRAVKWLHELGLDGVVLGEEGQLGNELKVVSRIVGGEEGTAGFAMMLAAWAIDRGMDGDGEFVRRWRRAILLTNDERDALRRIIRNVHVMCEPGFAKRDIAFRKRLYRDDLFDYSMRLLRAIDNDIAEKIDDDFLQLTGMKSGISPVALISGDDLVAMGLSSGPAYKRILDRVYDAQLREEVCSREEALAMARRLVAEAK